MFADWCVRLAASDASALDELFDAMHDRLLGFAISLVGEVAVARDLVQEAFIRIWDRRDTLDPARSLRALLFQTVRNLAANHRRDQRTRERLLAQEGALPTASPPRPDELATASDLEARLRGWIAALPERQREALELCRFHGLSHAEVAEVMDVTTITVNNHLVKALATLRAKLQTSEREGPGGPA